MPGSKKENLKVVEKEVEKQVLHEHFMRYSGILERKYGGFTALHTAILEGDEEAFEDWRARGIVAHVSYQRGGKHSPNYLRLWFPAGQAMQMQPVATGPVVQPGTGTFLVQVPPGAQAGQMMQVTSPAGVAMQVQIPAGMYPGATFAVASPR